MMTGVYSRSEPLGDFLADADLQAVQVAARAAHAERRIGALGGDQQLAGLDQFELVRGHGGNGGEEAERKRCGGKQGGQFHGSSPLSFVGSGMGA